jgi:endonuclease G
MEARVSEMTNSLNPLSARVIEFSISTLAERLSMLSRRSVPLKDLTSNSTEQWIAMNLVPALIPGRKANTQVTLSAGGVTTKGTSRAIKKLASGLKVSTETIRRAVQMLAKKASEKLESVGEDPQRARGNMAVPEWIVPYDSGFLGDGYNVPLPKISEALRASAYNQGQIFDYTHYSLAIHAQRRTALFCAHNVDAAHMVRLTRGNIEWRMDERIGSAQIGNEFYAHNRIDRGHLARREDVVWGTLAEAKAANAASFFYSNAAPQHENFNQDEWVHLEDWVLHNATQFSYRLCVFTGPVLRNDDPALSDLPADLRAPAVQIPAAYWKVIVLRDASAGGDDLSVVAFAMRQSEMWNDREGRRLLHLKVHQVTLQAIEGWTGLDFTELKNADELQWNEEETRARTLDTERRWPEIRTEENIVFSGVSRRRRGQRFVPPANTASSSNRTASPTGGPPSRTTGTGCGCVGVHENFDAKSAIALVSRDIAALADSIAALRAEHTSAPSRMHGLAPEAAPLPANNAQPDVANESQDDRINLIAKKAPAEQREKMRLFAEKIVRMGDALRSGTPLPEVASTRIVGGDAVQMGGYPSCVCIGNNPGYFCTGALVLPNVVLTAAHCNFDGITRIYIGGNRVGPADGGRIIPVKRVIPHPNYRDGERVSNDITILILAESAMQLPVSLATVDQLRAATALQLVGFGYNDPERPLGFGVKRQTEVPMGPINLDANASLADLEQLFRFDAEHEFVAGRKGLGRDTCKGDSGGPAYLKAEGVTVLAGLTSRVTEEAEARCGDGGIYVRPDTFRVWINEQLAQFNIAGI